MRTIFGILRPRRPGFGLLVLLLLPAVEARGQSPSPNPEYWVVQTRDCPQVLGIRPRPELAGLPARLGRPALAAGSRGTPGEGGGPAGDRPGPRELLLGRSGDDQGIRIRDELRASGAIPTAPSSSPSTGRASGRSPTRSETGTTRGVGPSSPDSTSRGSSRGSRRGRESASSATATAVSSSSRRSTSSAAGRSTTGSPVRPSASESGGPSLRLRAVAIASASDRHWLDPGERFDHALAASEAVLSLYNRLDPVLVVHPFGKYSDHRQASASSASAAGTRRASGRSPTDTPSGTSPGSSGSGTRSGGRSPSRRSADGSRLIPGRTTGRSPDRTARPASSESQAPRAPIPREPLAGPRAVDHHDDPRPRSHPS